MQKGFVMLNMEKVGRKIAELRKNRNMTQLELADKMGISFQAVSNWERGNSMPDISKLPELSELFGVTIDELLEETANLVDRVLSGDIKGIVESNNFAIEDIVKIAPVLKPNQVDEIFEYKCASGTNMYDIKGLLPFVGSSMIDALAIESIEKDNYQDLNIIAPFVSKNILNEIAFKMIEGNENIVGIAPFISRDTICELSDKIYQTSGVDALGNIAPFIPKEHLKKIAEIEYTQNGLCHFALIAPFLDRNDLNFFANKAIHKGGIKASSNIAPFLDRY